MDDRDQLLSMLNLDNADINEVLLNMTEALGNITLMLHWYRGMFNDLIFHNVLVLPPNVLKNHKRLHDNIELYERFLWEYLPPRAILPLLRRFRTKGDLMSGVNKASEALKLKDEHGRVPYDTSSIDADHIWDILRRINEIKESYDG